MAKKKHGKKGDKNQEKTQNISTETGTTVSDPQLPTPSQDIIAPIATLSIQSSSTQQPEILGPSQSTLEFPTVADSECIKSKGKGKKGKKQNTQRDVNSEIYPETSTSQSVPPIQRQITSQPAQSPSQKHKTIDPTIELPTVAVSECIKPKGKGKKGKKQNTQRDDNSDICSESSTSQSIPPIQRQLTSQPAQSLSREHKTIDPSQNTIVLPTVPDGEFVKPKGAKQHNIQFGDQPEQIQYFSAHQLGSLNQQQYVSQPAPPTFQESVQPPFQQSAQPFYQQPSQQSAQPSYQQPAQSHYQQPIQPPFQHPAQPPYQQPSYQQSVRPIYQQPTQQHVRPPYQQPFQQPTRAPYQQPSQQSAQPPYQQPAQPHYQQPTQPPFQQPARPPYQQPSQPPYQQPAQPHYQQPSQPPYQQPAQPHYQQPTQPPFQQPSQQSAQPPCQQSTQQQPARPPTRWQLSPQPASATSQNSGRKPHQQPLSQSGEAQAAQKTMSEQVKQQPQAPAKPPPAKPPPAKAAPAKTPPAPAKIEPQVGRGILIPKRSQFDETNKKGRLIEIDTNHLAIKLNKKLNVIHYDVAIEPDKPKKFLMDVVMLYLDKYFPKKIAAFDGSKNLYSAFPIISENSHTGSVEKVEPERITKYTIKIQFAAKVDFAEVFEYMKSGTSKDPPQSTLQCLDVVLRHSAHCRFVKVGRSFYSPPVGEIYQLSGGLELWYGHFQSAILGWKPFLNVDVAHKGFTSQLTILELIKELQPYFSADKKQKLDSSTLDALEKYLIKLKVEYQIPSLAGSKRTYRVLKVMKSPDVLRFKLDDGRETTVYDYFLKERKYAIRYPHLPCLSVGSDKRSIYYPIELCTVLGGQSITAKMDATQTTNLIRKAATKPDIRRRKIESIINESNFNSDEVAKEFGISVANKFERITTARILNAPVLSYRDRLEVNPRNGTWFPTYFKAPATINNWSIIILDRIDNSLIDKLLRELQNAAHKLGMTISQPADVSSINRQALLSKLSEAAENKYQIVMVVVSSNGSDYSDVKKNAELKTGVLTQCIQKKTIFKIDSSTATNILQKMNAKLTKINHVLHPKSKPSCFNEPCMIVGADVTHPPPRQEHIPSIAALACSHDAGAFQYNITLRLQPAKEEIIQDLRSMIKEQLIFFRKSTNFAPKHIIIFRDGVSEGQFEHVLNFELTAIRAACRDLSESFQPKVSFFIVQKRHHTRFFPTKPSDADRNGNALAGTCVDTTITHPTELDYYLLSHASIQGTARPTRYHCIWDDAGMKVDEIEHLTYYLCHLYSRCTRAVSYPTPTYYAHLAAARARVLTEGVTFNMDNLASDQRHIEILDSIRKSNPMFFV